MGSDLDAFPRVDTPGENAAKSTGHCTASASAMPWLASVSVASSLNAFGKMLPFSTLSNSGNASGSTSTPSDHSSSSLMSRTKCTKKTSSAHIRLLRHAQARSGSSEILQLIRTMEDHRFRQYTPDVKPILNIVIFIHHFAHGAAQVWQQSDLAPALGEWRHGPHKPHDRDLR